MYDHICKSCAIIVANGDDSHLDPTGAGRAIAGLRALGMITLQDEVYVSHDRCAACEEVIYAGDAYAFDWYTEV